MCTRIQAIKCIDCLDCARIFSFDTHTRSGTWDQYRWNIYQLILKKSIENSLLYHRFGSFQFPTWAEPALLDSLIYSIDWHREMKKRNEEERGKQKYSFQLSFCCFNYALRVYLPSKTRSFFLRFYGSKPLEIIQWTCSQNVRWQYHLKKIVKNK